MPSVTPVQATKAVQAIRDFIITLVESGECSFLSFIHGGHIFEATSPKYKAIQNP